MLLIAGGAWFLAFALFVVTYGPMLMRAKRTP
jgi:uncharacterized protein involved in response to NO